MQSRILQSTLLAANGLLFTPLVHAHAGEHATRSPMEGLAHLLTGGDHWPALLLFPVAVLVLLRLRKS